MADLRNAADVDRFKQRVLEIVDREIARVRDGAAEAIREAELALGAMEQLKESQGLLLDAPLAWVSESDVMGEHCEIRGGSLNLCGCNVPFVNFGTEMSAPIKFPPGRYRFFLLGLPVRP